MLDNRQYLHIGLHDGRLADVLQRDVPPLGGELHHGPGVHQAVTKLFGEPVIGAFLELAPYG